MPARRFDQQDIDSQHEQAVMWVNGSVALDTQAKTTIRNALKQEGILITAEKLLLSGNNNGINPGPSNAPPVSPGAPRLTFLVSRRSDMEIALSLVLSEDAGPNSLIAAFGTNFGFSTRIEDIENFFPPLQEEDASLSASSEALLTPENERRVFAFVNEDLKINTTNDQQLETDEHVDLLDELPVIIAKSPLTSTRSVLSQSSAASISSSSMSSPRDQVYDSPRSASVNGTQNGFRARNVPRTTSSPSITPKLSKAAALRMGIQLPDKPRISRESSSGCQEVDENGDPIIREEPITPGTVRRAVTPPKSLGKPSIVPRATKASALRTGGPSVESPRVRPSTTRRQSVVTSERSSGFEGLPGFAKKKVELPRPASVEPKSSPEQNRASMLRQSSQDRMNSPIPKPTQRRQSLTTAERAAANAQTIGRQSLDYFGAAGGRSTPSTSSSPPSTIRNGFARASIAGRPSLSSAESARDFFSLNTGSSSSPGLKVPVGNGGVRSKSPSIAPRANKAAELRLAAQKAGKA